MKILFVCLVSLFLWGGCGYKPSSHYAKNEIQGDVYVELAVDIENTQNSVYLKDIVNQMVVHEFDANLTDTKEEANTIMYLTLFNTKHTAISTDDGYTQSYRASLDVGIRYEKQGSKVKYLKVSDYYDYAVDTDSVSTEAKKVAAVKVALSKAISNLFSRIGIESMKK